MVTAKLKLIGVEPSVVGALHEAVNNSKFIAPEGYKVGTNNAHATILDCRLDKEYGTYTVSLDLHLRTKCGDAKNEYPYDNPEYFMHQSAESLRKILQAVDAALLPNEEKPVPADDRTREILAKRAEDAKLKRIHNEVNDLLNQLKGKSFDFDIVDVNDKVVLPAGRVLDGDFQFNLHNRILNYGLKLDTVTDERVKVILQKADDVGKAVAKV